MKIAITVLLAVSLMLEVANGQGRFIAINTSAPTRIGSVDGPFAGTNIYGQYLAGSQANSLAPVGNAQPHNEGVATLFSVTVTNVPARVLGYVRFLAWDQTTWGTDFMNVPDDQLGRTDIVTVFFTEFPDPTFAPAFTQPAIVPVPEPSAWVLGVVGAAVLWFFHFRRRARPKNPCR